MSTIGQPSSSAKDRIVSVTPSAAYRVGWLSVLGAIPIAVSVLLASGMKVVVAGFLPLMATTIFLLATHIFYRHLRPDPRLQLCSGLLAMMIAASLLAAVISHGGLRLRYPWIDGSLAAIDGFMGIDTPALALALALDPLWGKLLNIAYVSSFPAAFLTALALGARDKDQRAWELAAGFSACIIGASAFAVFFPALGNMVYHGIDMVEGLPSGAGNYHLSAVAYFRDGQNAALDLAQFSGIVTMPSFHMVMALLVPHALRGTGWAGWSATLWSVLITISTIGIGGHYIVDLIAGAGLWACVAWLCLERRGSSIARIRTEKVRSVFDAGMVPNASLQE
ncbi:membrane-associated phospholipid phosphatase [Sphingobium xenophagum]|uniref:Membrane-associated phospholipid phosphatase n=1 Tax=Sphingobium xenophagum TaxID=121428 RepID=A0ABU1WWP0_SPHXE|nr:phosphatase PAP2 family protein [Sphingobium xenophagum]MDR7153728.1 membrane-associated phospholipid phosphatase [Sphingobium xenophagum]